MLRKLLPILLLVVSTPAHADLSALAWLEGNWQREGEEAFEHWTVCGTHSIRGEGAVMREDGNRPPCWLCVRAEDISA